MKVFVVMPFSREFDDVYVTIREAVDTVQDVPTPDIVRLDDIVSPGQITEDLIRELNESQICIADLTGRNPNVMWEVGYAMATQKPVITITQDLNSLPFDLVVKRTIEYDRRSLHETLKKKLSEAFRETVSEHVTERSKVTQSLLKANAPIVGVTGSMEANHAECQRRMEVLLEPYLGIGARWYCGSYGDVDRVVCEFLISQKEKVTIVGYDAYDISDAMLDMVKREGLPFVDARREQLPGGFEGQTDRDVLFLTKTDVVILLWNGESHGTRALIDWYRDNEKDHVVGFVG